MELASIPGPLCFISSPPVSEGDGTCSSFRNFFPIRLSLTQRITRPCPRPEVPAFAEAPAGGQVPARRRGGLPGMGNQLEKDLSHCVNFEPYLSNFIKQFNHSLAFIDKEV
jgi:hypothetical protein